MRRVVDIFLVLVLLAAIGYFFFVLGDEMGGVWFETPTPARISTATQPPALTPTRTPGLGLTTTSSATLSVTATRTATSTRTPTATTSPSATASAEATPAAAVGGREVEDEINAGIQTGNLIVQAIEAFQQAQDQYPSGLQDLVPVFMPEIPVTATGQEYFYRLFDDTTLMSDELYWVAFKVSLRDHVECTYLRRLDYWDCNFASP
jgi:hypothetical protein